MDSSSGKSTFSRCAICTGLHAVDHRRSSQWGLFKPFRGGVLGPATIVPSGPWTFPASRSARTHATARRPPASPPSDASLPAVPSTAPPRRGRPACRPWSQHCGATHEKPSRVAADRAGDLAHALVLGLEQRYLLTLSERQVPTSWLVQTQRRHPASVSKPSNPDRRRHADPLGGLDRCDPRRDQTPELPLDSSRGAASASAPASPYPRPTAVAPQPAPAASASSAVPSSTSVIKVLRRPLESTQSTRTAVERSWQAGTPLGESVQLRRAQIRACWSVRWTVWLTSTALRLS